MSNAFIEGALAFIGCCTVGVAAGIGTYELILAPISRRLERRGH